jgi:NADPH:quinone reductase
VKPDEMKQLTGGHGIDIAINLVGGTVFESAIASLAYRGRLATVGYVDNTLSAKMDLEALHRLRLTLFGVSNKHRSADERAVSVQGFKRDVLPHLQSGRIKPLVDKVFPFDQLRQAQARMFANEAVGKIVIKMD